MKKGTSWWQLVGCISLILLVTSVAQADSFQYISSVSGGTVSTANWNTIGGNSYSLTQPPTAFASGSTTQASNGNTIAITDTNGVTLTWYEQGNNWQGGGGANNFSSGELLIGTYNPTSAEEPGLTLTLTFTQDIQEFLVDVQDNQALTFDASISVNGGQASYSVPTSSGNPVALGVYDQTGADISSVTISVPTGGSPGWFALGTADLVGSVTNSAVPEPGSLLLMAGGIAALAWKARKRSRA